VICVHINIFILQTEITYLLKLNSPKEKTGFFKLKRPLKLSMKEDENHVHFGFMPWIPFSDDEEVPLSSKVNHYYGKS